MQKWQEAYFQELSFAEIYQSADSHRPTPGQFMIDHVVYKRLMGFFYSFTFLEEISVEHCFNVLNQTS